MAHLQFILTHAFSRDATRRAKLRMAETMLQQVQDRIEQGGDDEVKLAPLDFPRVDGTQDKPLWNTGTHLLNSLSFGIDDRSFWVGSNFIGARVQQLGTKGKGGELPTIKPVMADALFLPMSKRGAKSGLQFGARMADRRRVYMTKTGRPKELLGKGDKRLLPRQGKKQKTTALGEQLEAKLRRMQTKAPDFMFVDHVDIRPRPYLRLSKANRASLLAVGFGKK